MSTIFDSFIVEFTPYANTKSNFNGFFDALPDELWTDDAPVHVGISSVDGVLQIDCPQPPDDEKEDLIKWIILCIERAGGRGHARCFTETTIIEGPEDMSDEKYLDTIAN